MAEVRISAAESLIIQAICDRGPMGAEEILGQVGQAQGWGEAQVAPIKGDNCWRAREGFRWRTATKTGWACAGPGYEVTVHEGEFDGSWP